MGKFIVINVAAAALYLTPVMLSKRLCYECTASNGLANQAWMSVDKEKEHSIQQALMLCQKHSTEPKQCEITDCHRRNSGC